MVDNRLLDKASSIANMAWAMGAFISPILGGGLYDTKGYVFATNFMSGVAWIYALVYFFVIFGGDFNCCKKKK